MDKETRDKYYRVVGGLEALELAAQHASVMPGDKNTAALLKAARGLLHDATTSAWEYAEMRTADSASSEGK